MPNESLIEALERLREASSQRQRATNSLMTALKGATSALGKAGRSLRDYAEQRADPPPAGLAQAQQAFGASRLKDEAIDPLLPDLRREAKAQAQLVAALKDALAALRGESVDVVKLGRAHKALQALKAPDAALAALLPEVEQELQQAQGALAETFGRALRDALAELGIAIGGRPPRFEVGRFEIAADFINRAAAISYGKNLVARRVPLSVEAVIKAYQRETKAIMGRNEDAVRWMEQFYAAWENARRRRDGADQRANIVDCYYEMVLLRQARAFHSAPSKHGFVDYSRAQFAYDFFEFANQQRRGHRGMKAFAHTATKSQAESADRSIWVVEGDGPHDGRYIGDVVFAKDE